METKKKSILDTRWDTKNIFVTTRHYFAIRNYINREGKSPIYLIIADKKQKIRIKTEIEIEPKFWDNSKKRIKKPKTDDAVMNNHNLVLDNIEAKIITVKTHYHLNRKFLSAEKLLKEFQSNTPDFDFISFYRHYLQFQKYKPQTIKNHTGVINKLENFMSEIPFHIITNEFLLKYRKFYANVNTEITYNSDLKCIKTFLRLAEEEGISLNIDITKLKVKVESNITVYLQPHEVKRMIKYYFNDYINPSHILPLGYFLFSCYTGLRISDVKQRTRDEVLGDFFQFTSMKNGQFQSMRLNNDARAIILHREGLFEDWIPEQKINYHLKHIAKMCGISKKVSMHVGRHTFATNYYRKTKDILGLKKLLGHSNIKHTMHYVHLVDSENLNDMDSIVF